MIMRIGVKSYYRILEMFKIVKYPDIGDEIYDVKGVGLRIMIDGNE